MKSMIKNKALYKIKIYNPYIHGVVGTDIRLNLKQKIRLLFSSKISIVIGDKLHKDVVNEHEIKHSS